MSGNTFGKIFKITTFGESHGRAMGCILDGCPPQIELTKEDIQLELDRRKPGQSDVTTQRKEDDVVEIMSGVFEGKTLGTPIGMIIYNKDQKSKDYSDIKDVFRPNHADITYQAKYGHRDYRGGGRASARETVNWVAAGAVAKKILQKEGITVNGFVSEIGKIKAETINHKKTGNKYFFCDESKLSELDSMFNKLIEEGNSVGAKLGVVVENCPVGLGDPVFEKLDANLAKAIMTINAVKSVSIGNVDDLLTLKGSEARDEITAELREEFAQRFEHDKGQIVEAMDTFITQNLEEELKELAEDKKATIAERVNYKKAVGQHTDVLNKFVSETLANEIKELIEDRNAQSENFAKLENFVLEAVADEIREFHSDKRELAEKKVQLVREGREQLADAKKEFIRRAAEKVEQTISSSLKSEVSQFKEDITKARENEFGRRIFEAMAGEYATSYLNENTEVRKLKSTITGLKSKIDEAKATANKSSEQKKLVESKLRIAEDRYNRNNVLSDLIAPLSKDKKELMTELLETVKTEKLEESFNKYLPSVMNEEGSVRTKKEVISESVKTEHTGNRSLDGQTGPDRELVDVVAIDEIRKLAGLK